MRVRGFKIDLQEGISCFAHRDALWTQLINFVKLNRLFLEAKQNRTERNKTSSK